MVKRHPVPTFSGVAVRGKCHISSVRLPLCCSRTDNVWMHTRRWFILEWLFNFFNHNITVIESTMYVTDFEEITLEEITLELTAIRLLMSLQVRPNVP